MENNNHNIEREPGVPAFIYEQIKKTPAKANRNGATILEDALAAAIAHLGITRPVLIKWSSGRRVVGCHRIKSEGLGDLTREYPDQPYYHSITISTWASPKKASEYLWHELTHAAQAERFSSVWDFHDITTRDELHKGYRNSRHEREARAWARAHLWRLAAAEGVEPTTTPASPRNGKKARAIVLKAEAIASELSRSIDWEEAQKERRAAKGYL